MCAACGDRVRSLPESDATVCNDTTDGFATDRAVASSVTCYGFATGIPLQTSTKALWAPMQGPGGVCGDGDVEGMRHADHGDRDVGIG